MRARDNPAPPTRAAPDPESTLLAHQSILEFSTSGRGTRNITDAVERAVRESGVQCGLAHVFVQHTSCSLTITENADPDVRRDLETIVSGLAPDGDPRYRHDTEGPDDMAAHARTMLTDTGLTVPIGGGRLLLGTWQGIFLWEHRTAPHRRTVVVTVLG
ncbi:secondary thiamine-phosphate synthase enzyme [Pseudoduganella flava]|uniref:Secondary thiamine-phosphate synthase enzyme n=1 Tax=Pseudoduganella flava TaxID=871742 RepID=A0A562PKY7_9BURK|nr:YjbQ family protein [Pseudoduganella flava]TWI44983.1 secondary thiamine-phosphate synthase enzyme [Pseudoduganella flava]